MELAFVIDAVRRYWWVCVVATLLGGAAGFLVQQGGGSQYRSLAVLLLQPPSEDPITVTGDNERYVANQLAVLSSSDLTAQVATALGEDFNQAEVGAAIDFVHIPETDIVQIIAEHPEPVKAQAIANGYLDQYFVRLGEEITGVQDPERERLNGVLRPLEERLDELNVIIRDRMADAIANATGTPPEPESVVPDESSEKAQLELQIAQVRQALTELDLQGPLQVASTRVQAGELPDTPVSSTSKILIAAGLIGGAFAGLLGAVLLARLSPRLLGPRHAEEILGQPLVGTMPGATVLAGGPVTALGALPHEVLEFVDLVCVRAEAGAQSGTGSLVVAVVGSERGAGTTTLAAAMANRFSAHGSEVLLVDADGRDRWLSRQLAPGRPGIPDLMSLAPSLPNLRDASDPDLKQCLRPTAIPNLRVLGAGDGEGSVLRRQNVSSLVAITSRTADVVVVDAGALMEASATVQLAHLADAVVLAIPDHQQASSLETVNRQLRGRRGTLLAVWSGSASRREATTAPTKAGPAADNGAGPPAESDGFDEAERQGLGGRRPQHAPGPSRSN